MSNKKQCKTLLFLVGVTGFEPMTSWSRTKRATNCATPRKIKILSFSYNSQELANGSAQGASALAENRLADFGYKYATGIFV